MDGATSFQTPSEPSDTTSNIEQGVLRRPRIPGSPSTKGTAMVDFQHPAGQRQSNSSSHMRTDDNAGCVEIGLGGGGTGGHLTGV